MGRSVLAFAPGALIAVLLATSLTACGKAGEGAGLAARSSSAALGPLSAQAPASGAGQAAGATGAGSAGTVGVVNADTTRVGSGNPIVDAAAVAETVFPGMTAQTRPLAVALVDDGDWRTALAASVLMSQPLRAPVLFTHGGSVPAATAAALAAIDPTGAPAVSDAQVIRVGSAVPPARGYANISLDADNPVSVAVALERLGTEVRGAPPHHVLIVNADAPAAWAMPAAGLAAESGAPILFVDRQGIPRATAHALQNLSGLSIYVIGPPSVVSAGVANSLGRYGAVQRIAGANPITNAIAVAEYSLDGFGWGVIDPGHGLVFVNGSRPLDAAAAAALSDGGDYGPILLLGSQGELPPALVTYLSAIQPGYTQDPRFAPVRGVYNRGWLIGGAGSIPTRTQAQLDALLAIVPRGTPPATTSSHP